MKIQAEPITFAIVAGEASGDMLGAGLMRVLKLHYPDAVFTGIGGAHMIAEGFKTLFPMERLSVMGAVEVLGSLREILGIRQSIYREFSTKKPTVFIGIDSPEFNIGLELKLKKVGVLTVHYVSPSLWAWRQKRIFKIKKAIDHMLTFLPFEKDFYEKHDVPVTFTGHPLADVIPLETNTDNMKISLGCSPQDTVIGLLPGSRNQEVKRLAPLFIQAAEIMVKRKPGIKFMIPCTTDDLYCQIKNYLKEYPSLDITLFKGNSHEIMSASDILLLASGTAALEAMLYKKPMVVSYKLSWLSWQIAKILVKTPWCSLPNILENKSLIPEILQDDATPERLAEEVLSQLENGENIAMLKETFKQWHIKLRCVAKCQ